MSFDSSLAQPLAQMGKLEALLDRMSELPRRVAVDVAPQITKLLRLQFRQGKDPYGRVWAPLRPATLARGRKPPPLTDTKALRDGTKAEAKRSHYAGLVIKVGTPYGYFAQTGFRVGKRRVSPRRILPQYGMPREWLAALNESASKVARQMSQGGR